MQPHNTELIQTMKDQEISQEQPDIPCPFCNHTHTDVLSYFGGNAGEILMHCPQCRSAFHWIKWQGKLPSWKRE